MISWASGEEFLRTLAEGLAEEAEAEDVEAELGGEERVPHQLLDRSADRHVDLQRLAHCLQLSSP